MNQVRKNFIDINEDFECLHCGFGNKASEKSCRNHCVKCLYSLHVDQDVPGDRLSDCKQLMEPVALEQHGKKGQMIVHQCTVCKKQIRNKVAPDDDLDALIQLGLKPLSG